MEYYGIDPSEKLDYFQQLSKIINKKMGKVDEESAAR